MTSNEASLCGCGDGSLRVFPEGPVFFGHSAPVSALGINVEGKAICVGYASGRLCLWKMSSKPGLRVTAEGGTYFNFDFNQSEDQFLTFDVLGELIELRNSKNGTLIQELAPPFEINMAKFLSDNQIVFGADDGGLGIINLEENVTLLRGHSSSIKEIQPVFGKSLVYSIAENGDLLKHHFTNGELAGKFSIGEPILRAAFDANGSVAYLSKGQQIGLIDATTESVLWSKGIGDKQRIRSVTMSDTKIATGHIDGRIVIWNRSDGTEWKTISAHNTPVTGLQFTDADRCLISSEGAGTIKIWQVEDQLELASFGLMPVLGLKLSNNDTLITGVIGDNDVYGNADIVIRHFGPDVSLEDQKRANDQE